MMPGAAAAQEHRFEVGPYFGYAENVGWMMGGRGGWFDAPHPGTGSTFGGRVAVRMSGETFLEVAVAYSDASGWLGGPAGPSWGGHMRSYGWGPGVPGRWPGVGTLEYDGNLVYGFRVSRWVPFLAAGFGALTSWQPGGSRWTDPVANLGGGVKLYVRERVALRADLRQFVGALRRASESAAGWSSTRRLGSHTQLTAAASFGF
jgi:hypothetical protein